MKKTNNKDTEININTKQKQSKPDSETKDTQAQMTDSAKESEIDCIQCEQNRKKKRSKKRCDIHEDLVQQESSGVIVKPPTTKLTVAKCHSSHGSFGDDEMDY